MSPEPDARVDRSHAGCDASVPRRRARAHIGGIVQGVGFRPYVYRLAGSLGLSGFVLNDGRGVLVEVEGVPPDVQRFLDRLPAEAPPLAAIEHLATEELPPAGGEAFTILRSEASAESSALVSPDTATCAECLAELFDPDDRRFRYPFINCTNCGPRFTIIRGIPYDRPLTTMAGFEMCAACRAEYENPADRRFHAQPNACPACGPAVWLAPAPGAGGQGSRGAGVIAAAAAALQAGAIVAVKGLGGFHLVCRADDEEAVGRLRGRKHREDKPFALMVPDLEAAQRLVFLDADEERLLLGRERPIVLARRQPEAKVAQSVAPGHNDLGVMLPYSPLHHLVLADAGVPLVMTSGNVSDEPIAYRNDEALERLAGIADVFLLHDRPIESRTDDSVVRVVSVGGRRQPQMPRRSRGYVPVPLDLPIASARPLLACGAELKNTFCVVRGARAWVSHHVGDLANWESLRSFREGIEHFERLFEVRPEIVAHDLHPEYLSTKYALDRADLRAVGVQHHHAHLAACLAEYGETGPAIGAIYDGTGYGTDGTVWGGEILVGGLAGFERVGHLWPVRMPGGEAAIREPWRMACAWLAEAFGEEPPLPEMLAADVGSNRWHAVARLAHTGLSSPVTSSVGRLFDAIAALCGLRARVSYEGQAAIELELLADRGEESAYPMPILDVSGTAVLDARELVRAAYADVTNGIPAGTVAARFHNSLIDATARVCGAEALRRGISTVVLSGGVFQNLLLLERTAARLGREGFRVLTPSRLPPNDGGISYGQAAVAAARSELAPDRE